ncbi:uncharacterized protein LOC125542417 [Triticum urartu]|uniref:mRNA cap-binding protein n=1 Tax=Triticum urartu TaxID=4572 RepID=A0A8R7PNJ0_TRIUA|nr:uncharacterized protein LOC125542417 [Triticum urartu]
MAEGTDTVRAPGDAEEMEKGEIAGAAAGADGDSAAPQPVEPTWAFWIGNGNPQEESAGRGNTVHTFSTVDDFLSLYNNILHPSKLGVGADLHCFKNKIEPKCQGPICANGGAWTISCGEGKSQPLWLDTLLALIGGQFEYGNEICGAVLSVCGKQETIAIWIKDATNEAAQLSIGKQWKEFLEYKDSVEFIVHDSDATAVQCWSSTFPDDPLDVIYNKVPSHCSRVRFAAVCRSWCTAASRHRALPELPWLLLSPRDRDTTKRLYCPEDSKILCISLPSDFIGNWFVGCHGGGWVASFEPPPFRILNIFSSVEVALSEKQKGIVCPGRLGQIIIWKIIFSKPPTSSDCIIAAITDNHGIALCRVGCPNGGWTTKGHVSYTMELADIAFCNGKLYGLTRDRWELVKFEIGADEDGAPVVTAVDRLVVTVEHQQPPSVWANRVDASYIFELHGKLATAVRSPWSPNLRPFFKVFELVDIDTSEGMAHGTHKWTEVMSLGDFALFLGPNSSKAVHVSADRRGGVKRNHIYYSYHRRLAQKEVLLSTDLVFLTSSNADGDSVYYREDESLSAAVGGVHRIGAVGYYVRGSPNPPVWLLPLA